MSSVLFRTSSGSIGSSRTTDSPRFSTTVRHDSFSSCRKLEVNRRSIRRALSEVHTTVRFTSVNSGSLPEEDGIRCMKSLKFAEKYFNRMSPIPAGGIALEDAQLTGFGSGSGRDRDGFGSGRSSGGSNNNDDRIKIGAHYQKLLESSPNDPLLLRNYGKYLHEIEGDTVKAEEYYGRAILSNPGDGELLSLYGKLIWDTQRDGERAQYYFDQAIIASSDDCMVMGSYAQFMWESEEDEIVEEELGSEVAAF